jgi:hypothetical protein
MDLRFLFRAAFGMLVALAVSYAIGRGIQYYKSRKGDKG